MLFKTIHFQEIKIIPLKPYLRDIIELSRLYLHYIAIFNKRCHISYA